VVAKDVMLRSTLARWGISAGYSVELAEGERQAPEALAHNQIWHEAGPAHRPSTSTVAAASEWS
jgi:hypothetical protein